MLTPHSLATTHCPLPLRNSRALRPTSGSSVSETVSSFIVPYSLYLLFLSLKIVVTWALSPSAHLSCCLSFHLLNLEPGSLSRALCLVSSCQMALEKDSQLESLLNHALSAPSWATSWLLPGWFVLLSINNCLTLKPGSLLTHPTNPD